MRTLTLIAVVGILIPSLLSLFQHSSKLPLLERIINSLAKMVKLSLVLGFAFGAVGFGAAFIYYVSPYIGLTVDTETIEISSMALRYYALIGVVLPITGILIGTTLARQQEIS
ncbi:hypothetical protein [Flammeovirga kamogawensis]|uniref:MotA/TolQ/ExbB proton channel domain-containing protein n=1 Tax=Flammeovirga kamogawensis TaxID=373891 RepID=A0ABX8GSH1_9BACT|nr:hypothetical protein [Flammeovirga kamogawensis]MBB6461343.1 type II secretory pathway component PulF [Flammeovirga kamogawensis]QWG06248.1 hypothetical protein KM029_12990 [Flammeovirga kamogawensis]TRX68078.1 hypothetical protein EO216_08010 [Flammeovirga kamogawensis]